MAITLEASAPARADRAIVFACDEGYAPFALMAAERIAALNPGRDFDICLCSDGPLAVPASLARLGVRLCQVTTGGAFAGLRLDPGRTEVVYLRLALPAAFAGEYARLLYYDADIFVQGGDFAALMRVDLGGHVLGAVRDNTQWRSPGRRPEQFRRLGITGAPYFNAGMLLIDVARWNERDLMGACVEFGRRHRAKMIRHDQNLLNGTLQGDWAELSPVWNWQYTRSTMLFEAMEDAHVVHFINPKKPWSHLGGQLPPRFRAACRAFLAEHYPERPQIGPDKHAMHQDRGYMRGVLFRHLLAVNRFCDYLDRFETDLTVVTRGGRLMARAWQRMLSGRRLDLLDPSPLDVEVEDIAHGLAFVARWNGQTRGEHPYSVAEHSLLVEDLYGRLVPRPEPRWRLAALLHDAPEYVIGDMISPVKGAVGPGYAALDARLARAVHVRFGLPAELPATVKSAIKRADRISAWLEATQLAGFTAAEADRFFGIPRIEGLGSTTLHLRSPAEVKGAFLDRHAALIAACRGG